MGVPDKMLFHHEDDALEIVRVSLGVEPPFQMERMAMTHALINSTPLVIGVEGQHERAKMVKMGYRLSRAMMGNEISDRLRFPSYSTFGVLPYLKAMRRLQVLKGRIPFLRSQDMRAKNFISLLSLAVLEDSNGGFSYRLPDHYVSDLSSKW